MTTDLSVFDEPLQGEVSWWRCARCGAREFKPVRWLWRNLVYGMGLVDCSCGFKWQEPGWRCIDGVWKDTFVEHYGTTDGWAVWSRHASIEARTEVTP